MRMSRDKRGMRALTLAVALATALFVGVGGAHARSAASTKVTATCWQNIVNDWLDHNGQIQSTYPIPCYRQAIQHLNGYADIQGYSNIIDDIKRAMVVAIQNPGPPSSSSGGGPPSSNGGGGPKPPSADHSWIQRLTDKLGPGNARSIPLPLLVLGGLALLLLLAAGGTWFAKRLQSRRVAPAHAPTLPRQRP